MILTMSQYLGGADNVFVIEAFKRSQRLYYYNFDRSVTGWTFTSDFQSVLLDKISYSNGEPDLNSSTIIGYFNNYTTVSNAIQVFDSTVGYIGFVISDDRYTGIISPHARENVVATIVSLEWTEPNGNKDSHRFVVVERWEPEQPAGDPKTDPSYIDAATSSFTPTTVFTTDVTWDPGFVPPPAPPPQAMLVSGTLTSKGGRGMAYHTNNRIALGSSRNQAEGLSVIDLNDNVVFNQPNPYPETSYYQNVCTFGNIGRCIDITDNYLIVGDRWSPEDLNGLVYIYNYHTNTLLHKIPNPVKNVNPVFDINESWGKNVAISGNYAVMSTRVGDIYERVLVYDVVAGDYLRTIYRPTTSQPFPSQFGYSVDIDGDNIVVSEPGYSEGAPGEGAGRISVFSASTGALLWSFKSTYEDLGYTYGSEVAIYGNYVAHIMTAPNVSSNAGGNFVAEVYDILTGQLVNRVSTSGIPTSTSLTMNHRYLAFVYNPDKNNNPYDYVVLYDYLNDKIEARTVDGFSDGQYKNGGLGIDANSNIYALVPYRSQTIDFTISILTKPS